MITANQTQSQTQVVQQTFAAEVRAGLTGDGQKSLPSVYLYDALGSALFEAITHLPEYGLTRADERLLTNHARAIARRLHAKPVHVAELGSGSGRKTRAFLQALGGGSRDLIYYPIDVSSKSLDACRVELAPVAAVVPLETRYLDGLMQVTLRREASERLLVLFLGSTIGNFDREEAPCFLRSVREILQPGDSLLLGADLVKPLRMVLDAYADATGVTAAFTLNLLGRVNRELGGTFDLRQFRHEANYNEQEQRIEIYARSLTAQRVYIRAGDYSVEIGAGERILTEYSHKYTMDDLTGLAETAGFTQTGVWVDHEWPFAECLWQVRDQ